MRSKEEDDVRERRLIVERNLNDFLRTIGGRREQNPWEKITEAKFVHVLPDGDIEQLSDYISCMIDVMGEDQPFVFYSESVSLEVADILNECGFEKVVDMYGLVGDVNKDVEAPKLGGTRFVEAVTKAQLIAWLNAVRKSFPHTFQETSEEELSTLEEIKDTTKFYLGYCKEGDESSLEKLSPLMALYLNVDSCGIYWGCLAESSQKKGPWLDMLYYAVLFARERGIKTIVGQTPRGAITRVSCLSVMSNLGKMFVVYKRDSKK